MNIEQQLAKLKSENEKYELKETMKNFKPWVKETDMKHLVLNPTMKSLVNSVYSEINASTEKLIKETKLKLEEIHFETEVYKEASQELEADYKKESEAIKEAFVIPNAIRGQEREPLYSGGDHQTKLKRAVEFAKQQQNKGIK